MKARIPHGALVIVCDGHKALFLRNEGKGGVLHLKVKRTIESTDNPITAKQGSDRPGRSQNLVGPTSAVDQTDWHLQAEEDFAAKTARAVENAIPRTCSIVFIAPPRTLAILRECISPRHRALIVAEIDKDYTKHTIHDIERLLIAV